MKPSILDQITPLLRIDRSTIVSRIMAALRGGASVREVAADIGRDHKYVRRLTKLMERIEPDLRESVAGWGINALERFGQLPDYAQYAVALVHDRQPTLSLMDIIAAAERLQERKAAMTDDDLANAVRGRRAKPCPARPSHLWTQMLSPREKHALARDALKRYGSRAAAAAHLGITIDTLDAYRSLGRLPRQEWSRLERGEITLTDAVLALRA